MLAIDATKYRVRKLARANTVAHLRELDCLRNRRICGHASHVKKLVHAESQEIEQVSIDARDSAAHTLGENRIDRPAMTEHSVHELAQPAAIARVEVRRSFLERCIEQLT